MKFPFLVKFEQKIDIHRDVSSTIKTFDCIKTILKSEYAEDLYQSENTISFKTRTFGPNTNFFSIIDRGEIELRENKGTYTLIYRCFYLRHFIISTCLSVLLGMISQNFVFALSTFLVLGLLNFLISVAKQHLLLRDLAESINKEQLKKNGR